MSHFWKNFKKMTHSLWHKSGKLSWGFCFRHSWGRFKSLHHLNLWQMFLHFSRLQKSQFVDKTNDEGHFRLINYSYCLGSLRYCLFVLTVLGSVMWCRRQNICWTPSLTRCMQMYRVLLWLVSVRFLCTVFSCGGRTDERSRVITQKTQEGRDMSRNHEAGVGGAWSDSVGGRVTGLDDIISCLSALYFWNSFPRTASRVFTRSSSCSENTAETI